MPSFENKWLKKRFVDKGPKELMGIAERQDQWVAMAEKPEQGGSSVAEPVKLSGPKGWSSTLVGAQATSVQVNNGASDDDEFNSVYGKYWGSAVVSEKSVAGCKTNLDAYARVIENEVVSAVTRFGEVAGRALAGPIGNSIGKITNVAGGGAAGKLTLTLRGDVFNFVPGMVLSAASADGSSAVITLRTGTGFVIAASPDGDTNGTQLSIATTEALQTAGTNGTPSGWANGDFLFRIGDAIDSTDNSNGQIRSLQAWSRLTNPAPGTLFGTVDVSRDQRLSGIKVAAADVAGFSILDRIQLIASEMAQASSAMPDYASLGPRSYSQAMNEAQSFGRFELGNDPKLGIRTGFFTLFTAAGEVRVICNPHQLEADIFMLTSKHLKIYNMNGFPKLRDSDGNMFLRQGENNEIQFYAFTSVTVDGRPDQFGRVPSGN